MANKQERHEKTLNEVIKDAEKGIHGAKRATPYMAASILAVIAASFLLTYVSGAEKGFLARSRAYIEAGIVLGLGIVVIEYLGKAAEAFFAAAGPGASRLMRTITRITGYGVLVTILASVFKATTTAAITLGSFLGMAAGFASQQVLGNALAGLFIAVSRPFKIGDLINVQGAKAKGRVVDIGVMYTVLMDGDKKVLVPSSKIMGNVIEIEGNEESSESS